MLHHLAGVLALVWMCVIFLFSAQDKQESGAVSEGVSYELVSSTGFLFHLHLEDEQIRAIAVTIEKAVRKGAHMTEYAILAVFFYIWLGNWRHRRGKRELLAVMLAVLYAASDEFHQLFVEGRAGRVGDVLIDSAGALLGVMLWLFLAKVFRRCREHEKAEKRQAIQKGRSQG